MKLCRHIPHKVITDILDPKFSTKEVLINVNKVTDNIEHYILEFVNPGSKRDYGWFYLSGKVIRKSPTQQNGAGEMYAVKLDKREDFEADNNCTCENSELDPWK